MLGLGAAGRAVDGAEEGGCCPLCRMAGHATDDCRIASTTLTFSGLVLDACLRSRGWSFQTCQGLCTEQTAPADCMCMVLSTKDDICRRTNNNGEQCPHNLWLAGFALMGCQCNAVPSACRCVLPPQFDATSQPSSSCVYDVFDLC